MSIRKLLGAAVFATFLAIIFGLSMDFELSASADSGTTWYCQTTTDDGCPAAFVIQRTNECCRNAKGVAAVYWCRTTGSADCVSAANVSCQNGGLYNASCSSPPGMWGNKTGSCNYSTTSCK